MKKLISIRRSLLINMLIIISVLSVLIISTTFWGVRQAVRTLSRSIIDQTLDEAEAELDGFFNPVTDDLIIASQWGKDGLLDINDAQSLNKLFMPILRNNLQISSVILANSLGQGYLLLKTEGKWLMRQTNIEEWGTKHKETEWSDDNPLPLTDFKTLDYDPLKRPWYKGAVAVKKELSSLSIANATDLIYWTHPYIFFTSKEPGITASLAYQGSDGTEWVIGFDVLLSDISAFTMDLRVSENGKVVVLSEDDFKVIGLPRDKKFLDTAVQKKFLLKTINELQIPVLADTMKIRKDTKTNASAYRLKSEGKTWWADIGSYFLNKERSLLITVVVPEDDLLGNLRRMRVWIFGIIGAVFLLAIVNVIALSGRYSKPIKELVDESERIKTGNFEPGPPIVSGVKEFNWLSRAHDHMREGLKTLFKLERDIQIARQIQQDTFPKELPQLKGYELACWSEPAEETGGDSYDVIGVKKSSSGEGFELTQKGADKVFFLLADATGHGIGPALSVTAVRSMLRMSVRAGLDFATIIKNMNAQLCSDLQRGRFITAWFGSLDVVNNTLGSFSAGQAPLFHFDYQSKTPYAYEINIPPLGITPDPQIKLSKPLTLNKGDMFIVLSDGLIETADSQGNLFGSQRVQELIKNFYELSPRELLAKLLEKIKEFSANAPASDDRTAIIIKRTNK